MSWWALWNLLVYFCIIPKFLSQVYPIICHAAITDNVTLPDTIWPKALCWHYRKACTVPAAGDTQCKPDISSTRSRSGSYLLQHKTWQDTVFVVNALNCVLCCAGDLSKNVAVAVGISYTEYYLNSAPLGMSAYTATSGTLSVVCGRISFTLGLKGPSVSIDTACSSSLVTSLPHPSVYSSCQAS